MKCPVCGAGELTRDTRDEEYTYKGETLIIPNVTADYCNECGESITDWQETERVMQAAAAFRQKINAKEADPIEIQTIRKKLRLNQQQAGEIFGGGVNAFSRYETGKATPPIALLKLLRLLDKHPALLDEVRNEQRS